MRTVLLDRRSLLIRSPQHPGAASYSPASP